MARANPAKLSLELAIHQNDRRVVCRLHLDGKKLVVVSGPPGKSTKKTHTLATPKAARAKLDAIVAERRAEGYRELGELDPPSVPIPRDPGLEAAIREDRDDPGPYLVYADWLQAQGCPLGELIALQHGKKKRGVAKLAQMIGLPAPDLATFGWHDGFWRWLRLENGADWMDGGFDPVAACARIFASPLCAVLEELRIGILRWDYTDQEDVIAEAGRQAWARDLARLHVGDVPDYIDMNHHVIGSIGKVVTKSFPNLRRLKLHSGGAQWRGKDTFTFDGLALPKLTELVIETCAMSTKRMQMLTSAKLPALERLEVWFGDRERDADATGRDVTPIVTGKAFPKLVHLGLRNSELVGDFVRELPTSRLAKQLVSLDLSMGVFGDDHAAELAAAATAFPKLTALDVSDSYLTKVGIKRLKSAFPHVKLHADAQRQPYDWNPGGRYVSVGE